MLKLKNHLSTEANSRKKRVIDRSNPNRHKKLTSMGKTSVGIINELYSPIDSINRFINLALQTIGEDSQSREFLLESKEGIRKTSLLLKRLNTYIKKIEEEIREITKLKEI